MKNTENVIEPAHCDDWFIYGEDADGNRYYVSTEMWPEWLDMPDGADREPNAVERYMLPIARKKNERGALAWRLVTRD